VTNTRDMYLQLIKNVLTNTIYEDVPLSFDSIPLMRGLDVPSGYDAERRHEGLDWPSVAHTMVGMKRLDNVQRCLELVEREKVPGDFIETGVWRGGVCIFARAFMAAHGITDRRVWVADSFQGIPDVGGDGHPLDIRLQLHLGNDTLSVSMEKVKDNFRRYNLLDDQVRFLPGWFRDSLPTAAIERLAILRLDGDLYESTTDALSALYPRLSVGGFVIVDDYALRGCRQAIDDFRTRHGIRDEVVPIDRAAAYWRRT
jgi:hypothetical protein